jgi:hypothetical protein
MITLIPDLPARTLGFQATGPVAADDYTTLLIPAVEAALPQHPKLRFLYCLGEDFQGFEPVALWQDARVGLAHLGAWERIAVVTDAEWLRAAMGIFSFLLPGSVRLFANGEPGAPAP